MRILVATAHRSVVGGVETYLRAVLPHLREAGHEVAVACTHPTAPGHSAVDEPCPGLPVWVTGNAEKMIAAADAWKPDVVYSHGLPDPDADSALAERYPTVRFVHDYAGTCIGGGKSHTFPGSQPCARRLGPACLALYLPRRCGGLNPATAVRLYRAARDRQALLARCNAVLVASRHMAAEVTRNGAPPERVVVAPLFPTTAEPDPDPPEPKPRSGRILFVGRIVRRKGWRELVTAGRMATAAGAGPITLVFAGDGADREACAAECRKAGVPAEILGWVGPDRVRAEMRAADVLAVPSVWPEPFGLVGIEAGCVGLPAVGFAVGGIPDWLEPGVSGELAPGDHPNAADLAAALVRVLTDDAHRHRLGVGAWEVARRFSVGGHLARLLPAFETAARP
jgi:glycosyltransferase involved in cell wall biosynthesis